MTGLRYALAWALYGIGCAIDWCFNRPWCGGMHWLIYRAYNTVMCWSDDVQGNGRGPWEPAPKGKPHE